MKKPHIVIDFSTLDHLGCGVGQYRYGIELIQGLYDLTPDARFTILRSGRHPDANIPVLPMPRSDLATSKRMPLWKFRGSVYINQLIYFWVLKKINPDLLHVLHMTVPIFCPCPIIVTKYDLMEEIFSEYKAWVNSKPYRLHRWACRNKVQRFICISKSTAEDLNKKWGISRNLIDEIPLGTDFQAVAKKCSPPCILQEFLKRRNAEGFILSVYNLEPRKNLGVFLEAFSKIHQAHPKFKLCLFGKAAWSKDHEESFKKNIDRLGIKDDILLLGRIPDHHLAWLYKNTVLFAFPSLYEGFGLPVLEAMSLGCLVMAHHKSSMPEIVEKGGILTNTESVSDIVEILDNVLGNPGNFETMREEARRIPSKYTLPRMASETFKAYMKTCK